LIDVGFANFGLLLLIDVALLTCRHRSPITDNQLPVASFFTGKKCEGFARATATLSRESAVVVVRQYYFGVEKKIDRQCPCCWPTTAPTHARDSYSLQQQHICLSKWLIYCPRRRDDDIKNKQQQ
jgi:hypothetical protein